MKKNKIKKIFGLFCSNSKPPNFSRNTKGFPTWDLVFMCHSLKYIKEQYRSIVNSLFAARFKKNLLDESIGTSDSVCQHWLGKSSSKITKMHISTPSKGAQDKVFALLLEFTDRLCHCCVFTRLTFNLEEQSKPGVFSGRALLENSTGQTAALPSPQRLQSPVAFDTVCSTNWWWWQVEGAVQTFREQRVQNWAWQRRPEVAWNLLITGDISQIWSSG